MRVDDQFELFLTVLSSPYMVFESERDRIATMLGIQLIGNTSNRFKAVFAVRYQDIRVAVMRDPEINNEEVLIVHFTFRDTKSYLGEKDSYVSRDLLSSYSNSTSKEHNFSYVISQRALSTSLPAHDYSRLGTWGWRFCERSHSFVDLSS